MTTAKLSTLLQSYTSVAKPFDRDIKRLISDSRQAQAGDLFFAYKGTHLDGRDFIPEVIAKGVTAIATDSDAKEIYLENNIPIIPIKNLAAKLSAIAAIFYGHPTQKLQIIGVTGTNGKTSCTHFLAQALQHLGISCGVIGTLGTGFIDDIKPGNLTTPDPISLQANFAELLKRGATMVAMEVSSHSIDQGRINDIPFVLAVFTNLTRDHLDYHGDMQTYGAVKKRLFESPLVPQTVINADDDFGKTLLADIPKLKPTHAYSTETRTATNVPVLKTQNLQLGLNGLRAEIISPWGSGELRAALVGHFNLSNLLAVLTSLCCLEIPFAKALQAVNQLQPVPGRMQALGGQAQPLVVVDYAHTPDALEKALQALKQHSHGKLHCVFGCGGDRDRGKRPVMAKIAEQYADQVVLTDDNPRHEDPKAIVEEILTGFDQPQRVIVHHERSKAIEYIIQCAEVNDCILIAGKGAETYQIIGDAKLPFSDVEQVKKFLTAY